VQADVVGFWTLKISTKKFTPSLANEMETSCGHGLPNKVVDLSDDSDLIIPKYEEKKIMLGKDYKIYENDKEVGLWSFVYDQSFILYYKNSVLTTPFKYYKHFGEKEAESSCGKTFLGWHIPDKERPRSDWSCFYGVKLVNEGEAAVKAENAEKAVKEEIRNKFNFLQMEISMNYGNENDSQESQLEDYIKTNIEQVRSNKQNIRNDNYNNFSDIPSSIGNNYNNNNHEKNENHINYLKDNDGNIAIISNINNFTLKHLNSNNADLNLENLLKYEQMSKIIEKLNSLDLGWKADIHPQYVGMSFAELKHKLGLNKGKYTKKSSLFASEITSFIQLGNKNSYNFAKKKAQKEKVDQFLKTIEAELSLISLKAEVLGENSAKHKASEAKENLQIGNKNNNNNKEKEKISILNSASAVCQSKTNNANLNANLKKNKNSNSEKSSVSSKIKTKKKHFLYQIPNLNFNIEEPSSLTLPEKSLDFAAEGGQRDKDSSEVFDFNETKKYIDKEISEIDENKLSKNWDWRKVGGISFVPQVRSQGSCGSCYVFSTMTSLEARLRVLTNNQDQTLFSKQFPLSCNFYAEGCNGGYPILVSKFLHEFEAVPESCFEYTETTDKCENVCDYSKFKKKYTVSKWGYLGGAYGKTSEEDIMKELRARGPLPGNILVHVGYGEEDGVKYWIGMNTWGDNWGEDGFFKIVRGSNESEIESMGDFMQIKVEDRY